MKPAICIACGCDDDHGCPINLLNIGATEVGCFWLRFDADANVGICSECEDLVKPWDQGARTPILPLIAERYYRQVMFLYNERSSAIAWVASPQPLLRGRAPRELILEGRLEQVQTLVDLIQSGAFA